MGLPKRNGASGKKLEAGVTIESLLKEARREGEFTSAEWKAFKSKYTSLLSKKPRKDSPGMLHKVADGTDLEGYTSFATLAIKEYPQLLDFKNDSGNSPLHLAILNQNHKFVELVLNHVGDDRLKELLKYPNEREMNCLHLAIWKRSPFTELVIAKASEGSATENSGAALTSGQINGGASGNIFRSVSAGKIEKLKGLMPLHMAATIVQEEGDSDEDESDDADGEDGEYEDSEDGDGNPDAGDDIASVSNKMADASQDYGKKPPDKSKATQFTTMSKARESCPGTAPLRGAKEFNLRRIVEKLVEASPKVLLEGPDTPFQARLTRLWKASKGYGEKAATPDDDDRQRIVEGDDILIYLREYIIDKFNRKDAMKALYKVGDERVIEFDLWGLNSKINTESLDSLGKVLRFEGLLKYITLPRLTVEDDDRLEAVEGKSSQRGQGSEATRGRGLRQMCRIFEWLGSQGVKSVLKVTVIDNVEPSHSDEAIETCLKTLDVRIWNWYKIDLCCDVIRRSATRARDVTLYSSGNNAVLMGWSSPAGLARLPELKKVHILIQEGLESQARIEVYKEEFTTALSSLRPDIALTWSSYRPDPNCDHVFTDGGPQSPTESDWMKKIMKFADFLRRAKPKTPVPEPEIKIAVIDDGIDTSLHDFTGKIQVGESFPLSDEFNRRRTYYVPSGLHGTLMAQLICKVCPVVKLYIAQLEVLPGQDGKRSFDADSAKEAILWAIDRGVDIISMSWSISAKPPLKGLEEALETARTKKIIMFCASIDQGPTAPDDTYPGRQDICVKIGACKANGGRLSWVSEEKCQFLLPGEIPQASAPRMTTNLWGQTDSGLFGSSVSTAVAAGLAGALMYCDRLLNTEREATRAVPARDRVDWLRDSNLNVKRAFKALCASQDKFIQLESLPDIPDHDLIWDEVANPPRTKETISALEAFMKKCHDMGL